MEVKMKVAGDKLEYDVHEQLYFDPEHVFEVIGKQAGMLAWWYSLLALKDQELEDYKVHMDRDIAVVELNYRRNSDDLVAIYGKVTESVIKAAVESDVVVVEAKEGLNLLKRESGMLKAMAKGMDTRSVLLATAGSAQRAELEARLRSMVGKAKED
jgi:hypothetical protein